MSWLEFFQGFPILLFRTEGAVILWAAKNAPYWQSLIFSVCWTSITLIFIYYGTAFLVDWLKRWWVAKVVIEKCQKEIIARKNNFSNGKNSFSHDWLHFQKQWVVLALAFVPYTQIVPGLGSAVIAVTRIFNIRWGIFFLIIGNAFRWAVITYHIYQGVHFSL